MQTHTHDLAFVGGEVRKRYVGEDRGEAEREWASLVLLAEHAPGLAPRPLRRESDGASAVVVMERLSGDPLGGGPLSPAQHAALGAALRRSYDVPAAVVRAAGIGERRSGPTSRAGSVADGLAGELDLGPCRDQRLVAEAVAAARAWLAGACLPAPRLSVFGIGDLNPANVLWDGTTCRLVDFEDAGLTDPAFELADHVEHLAGRSRDVYDAAALVDAVGLDAAGRTRFAAYRPLWAAFWLAMLLPRGRGFHRNPPGTTEAQARHLLALVGG